MSEFDNAVKGLDAAREAQKKVDELEGGLDDLRKKNKGRSGRYSKADNKKKAALDVQLRTAREGFTETAVRSKERTDAEHLDSVRSNAAHHAAAEHGPLGNPSSKVALPSSSCPASNDGSGAGTSAAAAAGAGGAAARDATVRTGSSEDEKYDIAFTLKQFNKAPPGHKKFLNDKILPFLKDKNKLVGRGNLVFNPPDPLMKGQECYLGAMVTYVFAPGMFYEACGNPNCPTCESHVNVISKGIGIAGCRLFDLDGAWLLPQRLQCTACKKSNVGCDQQDKVRYNFNSSDPDSVRLFQQRAPGIPIPFVVTSKGGLMTHTLADLLKATCTKCTICGNSAIQCRRISSRQPGSRFNSCIG